MVEKEPDVSPIDASPIEALSYNLFYVLCADAS